MSPWIPFFGGIFAYACAREVIPFLISEVRRERRTKEYREDQDRRLRLVLGGAVSTPKPFKKLKTRDNFGGVA